jgi:hypothetical protein
VILRVILRLFQSGLHRIGDRIANWCGSFRSLGFFCHCMLLIISIFALMARPRSTPL